jgi:hypothetical protein
MKGKLAAAAAVIALACSGPKLCSSPLPATFSPPETMPPLREEAPQPIRSASSTTACWPRRCRVSAAERPA